MGPDGAFESLALNSAGSVELVLKFGEIIVLSTGKCYTMDVLPAGCLKA